MTDTSPVSSRRIIEFTIIPDAINSITNIQIEKSPPTEKRGSRMKVQINKINLYDNSGKNADIKNMFVNTDAVLTLLKIDESKTDEPKTDEPKTKDYSKFYYSLSIKLDENKNIALKGKEDDIYIMPDEKDKPGLLIKYNKDDKIDVDYILITGYIEPYVSALTAATPDADIPPMSNLSKLASEPNVKNLKIDKMFYILNKNPSGGDITIINKDKGKDLSIEEFLNLYYINYFSFDNTKFTELYNSLKNDSSSPDPNPGAGAGGGSKLVKKKKKSKIA